MNTLIIVEDPPSFLILPDDPPEQSNSIISWMMIMLRYLCELYLKVSRFLLSRVVLLAASLVPG